MSYSTIMNGRVLLVLTLVRFITKLFQYSKTIGQSSDSLFGPPIFLPFFGLPFACPQKRRLSNASLMKKTPCLDVPLDVSIKG